MAGRLRPLLRPLRTAPAAGRWLARLLHVGDTPRRTAAAFAVGVFFGFSPWLGLHTVLGLAAAFVLRLNRVAVLLGVYTNVPWVIAPYYTAATMLGAWLVGVDLDPNFGRELRAALTYLPTGGQLGRLLALLRPFLWPFLVGSTVGAAALALAAYWAAWRALGASHRRVAGRAEPSGLRTGSP
jgi:uncharacterized protein (DUF2062 family)